MSPRLSLRVAFGSAQCAALLLGLMLITGCGKIKEKLEGQAEEPVVVPAAAQPAAPPPEAVQPVKVERSPKELVDSFLALPPQRKNDEGLLAASEHAAEIAGIQELVLGGGAVSDAGVAALPKFTGLKRLDLSGARISHKSLETIAKLTSLESLRINAIPLEDASLAVLKALPSLTELSLVGTSIGESAFDSLAGMEHLQVLDVSGNDQVLGRTFTELVKQKRFAALTSITANDSGFGYYGLVEIGKLPNLEFLCVMHSFVGDEALKGVAKSKSIKRLYLSGNMISDEGMPSFKRLTQLEELRLDGNILTTDAGLIHLRGLKALKELRLDSTRCTEVEARSLKSNLPSTTILFGALKL